MNYTHEAAHCSHTPKHKHLRKLIQILVNRGGVEIWHSGEFPSP